MGFSKFVLKFSVLMALKEVGQKTVRENFLRKPEAKAFVHT
jgi:hypothetical protein